MVSLTHMSSDEIRPLARQPAGGAPAGEPASLQPETGLQRLWTPWRLEYVGGPPSVDCFLCALAEADPGADEPNLVLLREPLVFLLLNRFPYNSGHLLVAPRAHIGNLTVLPSPTRDALFALVQRASTVLGDIYEPGGFNIGMNLGRVAGAGVPDHLHVHIVPRWNGDTNFMTVTAATRVLPEMLEQAYRRLRPRFD
jgi:ATP adenylyltransferase